MSVKSLKKQLMAAVAMVLVAAIALGSSTYAWFISNSKVTANLNSITSASATPSLYIKAGKTKGSDFLTADTTTMSNVPLYPASTKDLSKWSVVSGWATNASKSNKVEATNYIVPTVTAPTNGTGAGTYVLNSKTVNAYNVATYTLYTSQGSTAGGAIPVYVKSISVVDSNTDKKLQNSIRIGIKAGSNMLIYAPVVETKVGNSADTNDVTQSDANYYAVDDATLTALTKGTDIEDPTSLGNNKYVCVTSADATNGTEYYTADGKTALCTANTTGVQVEVYVWLEGTDGECLVGQADNLTAGLNVAVEFAGIAA